MKSPAYQTTEVSSTSVTAKYPCDFVCKCPASNSVEKAEQDLLAKLRDEVEGLQKFEFRLSRPSLIGRIVPYKNGEWIKRSEILALIDKEINK